MTTRCLATLEPLDAPGYTVEAQRRLAGAAGIPFPARVGYRRGELVTYVSRVVDRISISGVQAKVSLRLADGRLEPTERGGEFILKLLGMELPAFAADLAANEHVTMLLAERCFGIPVPPAALVRLADDELAYLVRRFDRAPDGAKVPQEDFAQVMGHAAATHGPAFKYESSYEELGAALRRINPEPAQVEELLRRIVFSYAFSNGDLHLKNISVFRPDPAGAPVLTPAYDLLCSSLHIPGEARLALSLFQDEGTTPAFDALGFESYACFLELGLRFGIVSERVAALLRPFTREQPLVAATVDRSFLSPAAREDYLARYRDRLKALRLGAPG